ncbi:phage baseplate assembly protein V [Campylobacter hyointestinalis]|uniref:phage baseplate assembly protein V n=1 Tax=Campylobacter hyointestinalis TaxID=198 RepID=UPI00072A7530|nr:phage baseplate assembly protein V [Campylobacter hyointestinalis]PPB63100.1 phage baseplate assembly protein V [Campylobacter hyointestinalis subsp. hyointestinalis]PPB65370.1 phage baseplate assembly protein V [Campylobacter hyointestinalis subsp. hyointestinalis]CUU72177.1 baseplate assembly protein V [Campylobacter hyointestinalis subsp. hyointestinalis]
MITLGTICEVEASKSLVKVNYQGTISKFIPYLQKANSYKQSFTPPRVGEQVVLYECSNGSLKFCEGAICTKTDSEPSTSSPTKEITRYEDGTIVSYDTSNSTMEILNPKTLNLSVQNDVNITCKSANIIAEATTITSPSVMIKGNTTIEGTINTTGSGGGAGAITMNGTLNLSGDLVVGGNISDSRGDLTGHSHSDTDGYTSSPR